MTQGPYACHPLKSQAAFLFSHPARRFLVVRSILNFGFRVDDG